MRETGLLLLNIEVKLGSEFLKQKNVVKLTANSSVRSMKPHARGFGLCHGAEAGKANAELIQVSTAGG